MAKRTVEPDPFPTLTHAADERPSRLWTPRPFDSRRHLSQRRRQACCCGYYPYYPYYPGGVCLNYELPSTLYLNTIATNWVCSDCSSWNAKWQCRYLGTVLGGTVCLWASAWVVLGCRCDYLHPTSYTALELLVVPAPSSISVSVLTLSFPDSFSYVCGDTPPAITTSNFNAITLSSQMTWTRTASGDTPYNLLSGSFVTSSLTMFSCANCCHPGTCNLSYS
jgi:hypothetical protein